MWVFRAGKDSFLYNTILEDSQVYLPWEGYDVNLGSYMKISEFRHLVENEKHTTNRTSISNWSSQLKIFVCDCRIGDFVLIPARGSRYYTLARIEGNYEYHKNNMETKKHSRTISIIVKKIPRDVFTQDVQYMLGAFRTIFKARDEEKILSQIAEWQKEK